MWCADTWNHCIRKLAPQPGAQTWTVTTLAGCGEAGFANGYGQCALFHGPYGIAVRRDGGIFVADLYNNCIRKVTPEGCVSTYAGSNDAGYLDGRADLAKFSWPHGVCFDMHWRLLVCDLRNHCIRRITQREASPSEGGSRIDVYVETFAGGTGTREEETARSEQDGGFADGAAAVASFKSPVGIAADDNNSVLVTDRGNQRVRMVVETVGVSRTVVTLAGAAELGNRDGPGEVARFDDPRALAIDRCGRVLIAEERIFALDSYWVGGQLGLLRRIHTLPPWHLARVLYIGLLKEHPPVLRAGDEGQPTGAAGAGAGAGAGEMGSRGARELKGCFLALLPLEAAGSCSSAILRHILILAWQPVRPCRENPSDFAGEEPRVTDKEARGGG